VRLKTLFETKSRKEGETEVDIERTVTYVFVAPVRQMGGDCIHWIEIEDTPASH
jgi:hypothetical protein